MEKTRPKIGVALSGASGRAIAHIGVLEVFKEHNIPIDYLVGCSSGALIAAAYVTNTLEELKKVFHEMTVTRLLNLSTFWGAKGGLVHLDKADDEIRYFTKNLKLEQTHPKLGFVAADIHNGELVNITEGDMLTAFKASVAVPGLFEPAVINNRVLVDGGLVNIVPTKAVKDMGANIVIGINIAATKFIYEKKLPIWRGYRFITRLLGLQFIREKILPFLSSRILFQFDSQSDVLEQQDVEVPGVLSVMTKALDWSMKISEEWTDSDMACDLMIEPRVKHYGKTEFDQVEKIYNEGRKAAKEAVPHIKKMIEEFERKHEYQRVK